MTPAPAVRLLHLTDPHLFADPEARLRGVTTAASFRRVLDHVQASGWKPDVVAMTGDVAQDDSVAAYERLRDGLAALGVPVQCVPGNHDVVEPMRRVLDVPPFVYCGAIACGAWLVAGVDSRVAGAVGGRLEAAELERLEALLERTPAAHAVVCLHHPPLPVGSAWLDETRLADGEGFLRRLAAAGNVRLVLFGHVHQAFEGEFDGIRVLGTPSTCRQFLENSVHYAVSDKPPTYRRVTLGAEGAVHSELVYVETGASAAA